MNIYDIGIEPGGVHTINVQADYIYFRTGSAGGGDTTVVFQPASGGESVYLQPGQAYKMPAAMRGKNVTWVLRNLKGEGRIAGVILMGEGEFQDNRVSGSVEVIDGGRNRTMANQAFQGTAYAAAVAARFPQVQLFNPANSGRRVVIGRVSTTTAQGGAVGIVITIEQTAVLDRRASSKLSGGARSIAEMRTGNTVAVPAGEALASNSAPANVAADRTYLEPVVLMPGYGLTVYANALGADVVAAFEFCEEAL